jgi:hypothetical protein
MNRESSSSSMVDPIPHRTPGRRGHRQPLHFDNFSLQGPCVTGMIHLSLWRYNTYSRSGRASLDPPEGHTLWAQPEGHQWVSLQDHVRSTGAPHVMQEARDSGPAKPFNIFTHISHFMGRADETELPPFSSLLPGVERHPLPPCLPIASSSAIYPGQSYYSADPTGTREDLSFPPADRYEVMPSLANDAWSMRVGRARPARQLPRLQTSCLEPQERVPFIPGNAPCIEDCWCNQTAHLSSLEPYVEDSCLPRKYLPIYLSIQSDAE